MEESEADPKELVDSRHELSGYPWLVPYSKFILSNLVQTMSIYGIPDGKVEIKTDGAGDVLPTTQDDSCAFYVSRTQIVAEVAKWAIRQSPYMPPAGLAEACEKLFTLLKDGADDLGFFQQTPKGLEDMLHAVIALVPEIVAWNTPRSGHTAPFVSTSRYRQPRPEDDFIDLHALVRNVRMELVKEAKSQ